MRKFAFIIAIGLGLPLGAAGCASGEAVSPLERAVGMTQEKIEGGRTKGQQEADVVRGVFLRVRYNPARCDVPSFEVFTHERWTRVFFDGNQDITSALQEFESSSAVLSQGSYLEVSGKFSGRRRTDNGVRYPVFTISELRKPTITDGSSRAGAEPFKRVDEPRVCL